MSLLLAEEARAAVKATAGAIRKLGEQTACQVDPHLFDGPHEGEFPQEIARRVLIARAYCQECPVRYLCLNQGRTDEEAFGVLGGELFGAWHDPIVIQANEILEKESAA